jgi:hypothetical protein
MGWATFWAIFSQTHLVTLYSTNNRHSIEWQFTSLIFSRGSGTGNLTGGSAHGTIPTIPTMNIPKIGLVMI